VMLLIIYAKMLRVEVAEDSKIKLYVMLNQLAHTIQKPMYAKLLTVLATAVKQKVVNAKQLKLVLGL